MNSVLIALGGILALLGMAILWSTVPLSLIGIGYKIYVGSTFFPALFFGLTYFIGSLITGVVTSLVAAGILVSQGVRV